MPHYPVSHSKEADLHRRMKRVGIKEKELQEKFVRGSGAGGQKINKTSIAVWIKHPPSKLEVRCQLTRSRAMNRFFARRRLVEKLEERIFKEKSEQQKKIEKIRRQKRRRSKRAKDKMLANKKYQARKKEMRRAPRAETS